MNNAALTIGSVFQLVFQFLGIVTILLFIIFRKKFNQPEKELSKRRKIIFVCIAFSIIGLTGFYLLGVYYIAYHPDYKYEETSKTVGFHIYKPDMIPGGRQQTTTFYLYNKKLAGKENAVRVAYSTPFSKLINGEKTDPIIITQAKMDDGFNLNQYVNTQKANDSKQETKITSVPELNRGNHQAYLIERPFGIKKYGALHILTNDNILVEISTIGETSDDILKIGESLN